MEGTLVICGLWSRKDNSWSVVCGGRRNQAAGSGGAIFSGNHGFNFMERKSQQWMLVMEHAKDRYSNICSYTARYKICRYVDETVAESWDMLIHLPKCKAVGGRGEKRLEAVMNVLDRCGCGGMTIFSQIVRRFCISFFLLRNWSITG